MTTANAIDPIDHLTEIGKALVSLGESPDAARELRAAFDRDDHSALSDILGRLGIEPPGDLCYPYVTILIAVTTYKWVRHCWWVPGRPKVEAGMEGEEEERERGDVDIRDYLVSPIDTAKLLELLQKLGYIKCEWRLERNAELKKLEKFVQGMCPPGTF